MTAEKSLWGIVPAAGRGVRFGGERPKQYVEIAGKSLLLHTLERLACMDQVAGLVVVIAADDAFWSSPQRIADKPVVTVTGGIDRAASVLAGLAALDGRIPVDEFVLVHDAVRPNVSATDIARLMTLGIPAGGALLAAPLRDTLKRADSDSRVVATEPREHRWRAMTPQLFRRDELASALTDAQAAGVTVSDESMAMERAGYHPLLVEGRDDNIKVTTRADLAFAEFVLVGAGNRESGREQLVRGETDTKRTRSPLPDGRLSGERA